MALFLPVVLNISLPGLVSVFSGVKDVSMRYLNMVRRSLVIFGLVVFSRFSVVFGGLGKMF